MEKLLRSFSTTRIAIVEKMQSDESKYEESKKQNSPEILFQGCFTEKKGKKKMKMVLSIK